MWGDIMKSYDDYLNILNKHKGRYYTIEKLVELYADGNDAVINKVKTVEYDYFYNLINKLVKNDILVPKGKKFTSNPFKPLSLKYEKLVEKEELSEKEKIFIHNLNPKININIYNKKIEVFRKDKELLSRLSEFLNCSNHEFISVKERSLQLFNDEKMLQNSGILNRTKIDYNSLTCIENPEPLLCFIGDKFYLKNSRKILIIENLDTYWTFHKLMLKEIGEENKEFNIDMIIYGSGYGITDINYNFSYYSITQADRICYFGDLDSEGICIYQLFKSKFENLNINLAVPYYKYLLDYGLEKGFRYKPTQNTANVGELVEEIKSLSKEDVIHFVNVINNKLFVPQEALNAEVLRSNKELWRI